MFGIKKLKERIENLEMENKRLKADVKLLLDVCKPQIDEKIRKDFQDFKKGIEKILNIFTFDNECDTSTIDIKENDKNKEDVDIKCNHVEEQPVKPKYDKNGIKYKDVRYSSLMQYYTKYNLNLEIRGFKPMKRMGEKEAATLLYLFDKYKYVDEIAKHIHLSKTTIITYAYELRKEGYLIYDNEIGRVANGCLIYKGV